MGARPLVRWHGAAEWQFLASAGPSRPTPEGVLSSREENEARVRARTSDRGQGEVKGLQPGVQHLQHPIKQVRWEHAST